MTLSYVISGFAVGILVGLTGVGGGSLMTPLLTLLFGVSPTVAVGTDLAFASVTKSAGTLTHKIRGTVNWSIVRLLCLGALPAAIIAAIGLKHYGALDKEIGQIIRYTIAASVLLTVIALLFKSRMLSWLNRHPEKQLQGRQLAVATVISGAVLGALVTVSSIGAGAIGAGAGEAADDSGCALLRAVIDIETIDRARELDRCRPNLHADARVGHLDHMAHVERALGLLHRRGGGRGGCGGLGGIGLFLGHQRGIVLIAQHALVVQALQQAGAGAGRGCGRRKAKRQCDRRAAKKMCLSHHTPPEK